MGSGLFDNIFYLIPIAFIIAFRIINARNKQNRKQQQKTPAEKPASRQPAEGERKKITPGGLLEELLRKAEEAQQRTAPSRRTETRDPAVQRMSGPKKPGEIKKKKLPKKQTAEKPAYVSLEDSIKTKIEQSDEKTQIDSSEQKADVLPFPGGILQQKLSPLQQAVVWSEILGQPKGY